MENDARTATGENDESVIDDYGREYIAKKHRFPANATGFLLAPVTWMLYFVAVYSMQGAGCAAGLDTVRMYGTDALKLALGTLTGLACAVIVLSGVWSFLVWRRLLRRLEDEEAAAEHHRSSFLAYGALLHAAMFLVATLWSGIPIMLLDSACDNLGTA